MRRQLVLFVLLAASLSACATKPKSTPQTPVAEQAAPEESGRPGATSPDVASLSALQAEFAAQAGDRVFFELDRYDLSSEAQAALARQAAWLVRHPDVTALIEGNCDERGTREYNLALGARRANSAMAFLAQHGVSAGRMRTISYGKERPMDGAAAEEAWAQNRNAHSVLIDIAAR